MGAICEQRIGKTSASGFEEAVAAIKEHATGQLEAVLRRGSIHVIQCVDGAGVDTLHRWHPDLSSSEHGSCRMTTTRVKTYNT